VTVAGPFGRILLITGNAEYLRDRTRAKAVASIKNADAGVNLVEATSVGVSAAELIGMTGPSLFSETTAIVLTEIENLADDASDALVDYAANPQDEITIVLVHSGGNKGRGLLQKLRASPSVDEVAVNAPKYDNDYAAWVRAEARDRGRKMDDRAAVGLVNAIGKDLRALAGAIDQLALTLADGEPVTSELIDEYFSGRAEIKTYEIADAAFEGNISRALEKVRWSFENKVSPVFMVAAFASGVRGLASVSASAAMSDGDIAKAHGMPPFKVKAIRSTLRGWNDVGIAHAIEVIANADTDVKGGAADAGWVIERLVIDVAKARDVR